MIGEGILIGILGNAAFEIVSTVVKEVIGEEDDEITKKLYNTFENASERFFNRYGDQFGEPCDSFLARRENWKKIVGSFYYSSEEFTADKLSPEGFHGAPEATDEALEYFEEVLKEEIHEDWFLDKILTEKKTMKELKEDHTEQKADMKEIKQLLGKAVGMLTDEPKEDEEDKEIDTKQDRIKVINGDSFDENFTPEKDKIYSIQYDNGAVIKFMVQDEFISAEYIFPDGKTAYYDVDFNGNVKNIELPYSLEEYSVEVPDELVLDKRIKYLPNGCKYIVKELKWNKKVEIVLDENGRLQDIHLEGGIRIDHQNKKFIVSAPE